jgi:hypothetical protein
MVSLLNPKRNLRTFDNYADFRFSPDPLFESSGMKLSVHPYSSKSLYSIENVLTPMECQALIQQSVDHYQSLSSEFLEIERQANRVLTQDPIFADILYQRLNPFIFQDSHLDEIRPCGFGTMGKWIPDHINSCFRFNQYVGPSIGFTPHRDATYIRNEDLRSILTILIYLNDDFEGGTTSFYKTMTKRTKEMRVCDEMKSGSDLRFRFSPKQGSVLLFNHNMIHSGDPLPVESTKYLIRTDLVFRRVERPSDYNYLWQIDPDFIQAVKYFREAMNQEMDGNIEKASIFYEKSLTLRQCHRP